MVNEKRDRGKAGLSHGSQQFFSNSKIGSFDGSPWHNLIQERKSLLQENDTTY